MTSIADAGAPPLRATPHSISAAAGWYGLGMLVTATVFASVVRQILVLVTEPLKKSLDLSDTQIGLVHGIALSLVAMLATLPFGWLADRMDRRRLLAVCILVWSAFTAACGASQGFWMLFGCSMGIAIAEAVLGPISYSMIADLFPRERWMQANYVYFVTGLLGGAAGMAFSGGLIGFVESHHAALPGMLASTDSWRVSLYAAAVPGVAIALGVALIRRTRSAGPTAAQQAEGLGPYLRQHLRTFVGVFLGFGLVASAMGAVGSWLPVVAVREFGETPASTGLKFGLVMAVGAVAGVALSWLLARWMRERVGQLAALKVAQIGGLLAALTLPAYLAISTSTGLFVVAGVQSALNFAALSLSPTVLQLIAPGHIRGRVIAIGGLALIALQSLGPVAVGAVSDALGNDPHSLLLATIIVGLPAYLVGLLFLRFAEPTMLGTFAAVERAEAALQ